MGLSFNVLNEQYLFKNAEILCVIENDTNSDRFLFYAVNDYEDDDFNFMVSYLRTDNDGYDYLEVIDDIDVVNILRDKLKFIINGGMSNE